MGLTRYIERIDTSSTVDDSATLPFEKRQKTRLRVTLDQSGEEVGLVLPRGSVLRDGDLLRADDSSVIQIIAAREAVSTVVNEDAGLLARAAYHLGNRHVWVQIGDGWIRYLTDHVLDDMLIAMGYPVAHEREPFEPEGGAYSGTHNHGGHSHHHSHD